MCSLLATCDGEQESMSEKFEDVTVYIYYTVIFAFQISLC